ncbi:MAG: DNA repair protein RecN [Solirubrobacteraceae bacterium]
MLLELRVENLLLIERAELCLGPGLNVLTGETGAGKTVLAHALDLLLGGRARPGIVRPAAAEAYVEGVFDLPPALRERLGERLAPDAQELVLARRVGADGRTRAYLGGRSASVGELREAGAELLTFYGQHEHRKLTLAGAQLQILDAQCGPAQEERLRLCAAAHARVHRLEERLAELRERCADRDRELDLLAYELSEIEELAPDAAEHARLLSAREKLRSLDALREAAAAGEHALAGDDGEAPGAAALLALAASRLDALAGLDPALDGLGGRLRGIAIEAQELAGELRDYGSGGAALAADLDVPGMEPTLEGLEARLAATERVMRKHGGSIEGVLEYAERARARHAELDGAEDAIAAVEHELANARGELQRHSRALRKARRAAAEPFAAAVRDQLDALAMAGAGFEALLGEAGTGPSGADTVEFMIAPNPGVPAGPLREIASGGELSRVMLAIMSVAAGANAATLVFDEVDAGIGGRTANAVGARLRELGEWGQVICITHLPQIASLGARHFSIVKDAEADPALATVVQLREPDVLSELVRMLGADSGDSAARRHARDLRRAA